MRRLKGKILQKKLERLSAKILKTTPTAKGKSADGFKTEIFLLGDAEMKRLKKKFLPHEKGPANILSFEEPVRWPYPEKGRKILGEIYLNLDLARGKEKILAPLLLHGIVHLLGYDHKKKGDRIKMEKLEKRISEKLRI
ncbi:MAG: rRNA maturation RNase YbeY [Candidatus Liptonbacteria bacterium]|nr:rRNA maturation RNase YbeY [Candidatus Liptonbacteria bacterium]